MEKKMRIMVVDDEERFLASTKKLLEKKGYTVETAAGGAEALDKLIMAQPQVIILDVKMPGMDGIETLKEIKARFPLIEVIMLTGHATLESGTQAMRKGAYDYLMKPCDIEDLVEKIKEAHEAEEIKRHPVLWPRKLVREITLHPFGKLHPEEALSKALEIMSREEGEESTEEVYVVDREDRPLGIVTRRDLVNEAQKLQADMLLDWAYLLQNPQRLPQKTLKEVMRPQPLATQANAYLTDAANQMIVHNLRRLPVVRAEKMIGVIKLEDVFQYMDHEIE